jgi:hypothetical protein
LIWRDDDILMRPHTLDQLLAVDDLIQRAGAVHTVAIISETLTPELANVIRERRMDAQLHCWAHAGNRETGLDDTGIAMLPAAVEKIEELVGTRPTTFYPPWNKVRPELMAAADALGLTVSAEKLSLGQYLRGARGLPVNFHFWHQPDVDLLKQALAR